MPEIDHYRLEDFRIVQVAYITLDPFTVQEIGMYGEIFWIYEQGKWEPLTREEYEKKKQA